MNNYYFLIKRFIFLILLYLTYLISKISLIFNIPYLTYLSWLISLRKIQSSNNSFKKIKVLILEKSFGVDDIKSITKKKLDHNMEFFLLSRLHAKIVYNHFQTKKHILYLKYINKIIYYLKKNKKINLIISFNINYYHENIFQEIDKKIGVKFLLCQKESLPNEAFVENYSKDLKNKKKFTGDLIVTYNKIYRDVCIESKFANKDLINIIGMPRADYLFKKEKNLQTHITFFIIRGSAGLMYGQNKFNWNPLVNKVLNRTLDFAEENNNQKIIFKSKLISDPETHIFQKIINDRKLPNCEIIKGGSSHELISNSKFLVCFHSTSIFEGLISRVPILIPYFDEYKNQLKKFMCDVSGTKNIFLARNIDEFMNLFNQLSSGTISYLESERENEKKILENNIGNADGKSTIRFMSSIESLFP